MTKFLKIAAIFATLTVASSAWGHLANYFAGVESFGDIMLWADQTIINTTILTMAVMIISRRLEMIWIPILLAAGEIMYDSRLLISGLHSILLMADSYKDLLGRHATMQVNPQYAMVLAYVVSFLALSAICVSRARRSFDRVIVLVMAASIMTTFTLFHTFLMVGISRETASEGRALTAVLSSPAADFDRQCRSLEFECLTVSHEQVSAGELDSVDPLARHTLKDISSQGVRLDAPFVWDGAVDDDASRTTFFIIGLSSDDNGYRIARSKAPYEEATEFEGMRYSAQALAAHMTWFLMGCGLIAIHRRHARPKVRRMFSEESFR
mgnify:CR=1 FL=1|jgi:hypothetical protein